MKFSPILSATPSPSSSIRSSFPSPSLSLTTPPGTGAPHSGALPGLRHPAPASTSSSTALTNTIQPSPLASTLAPDPTAGAAPLGAASRSDLLRRELDTRFLASQDRGGVIGGLSSAPNAVPPASSLLPQPFLHTEMHHHQHQHTHIHQHSSPSALAASSASRIPPTSASPSLGLPPTPGLHGSMLPPIPGLPPALIPPAGASSFLTNPLVCIFCSDLQIYY